MSTVVRRVHLLAALAVWVHAEDPAAYVFGGSLGGPVADQIIGALRAPPEGPTRTEIRSLFNSNAKADRLGAALEPLPAESHASLRCPVRPRLPHTTTDTSTDTLCGVVLSRA